jgi:hypothetical protein
VITESVVAAVTDASPNLQRAFTDPVLVMTVVALVPASATRELELVTDRAAGTPGSGTKMPY